MRKPLRTTLLVLAACFALSGACPAQETQPSPPLGSPATPQSQNEPEPEIDGGFCRNDPRLMIRAFCMDLAMFQSHVNSGKAKNADEAKGDLNKLDLSNPNSTVDFITAVGALVAAKTAIADTLRAADQARLDQQLGTNNKGSGTTSLVSKTGSAELLSLALDTGVLTRSVNGTTTTLGTNADELFRLITGRDPDCTITCDSLGWFESNILGQTNLSASFDLAQQNTKTTPTSGQASGTTPAPVNTASIPAGAGRMSSIGARYEVRNRFDPRSSKFQENWRKAVAGNDTLKVAAISISDTSGIVQKALNQAAKPLDRDKIFEAAHSDKNGKALMDFFEEYFSANSDKAIADESVDAAINKVMQQRAVYRDAWFKALDAAVGTFLTLDYSYNRPLLQPPTHDLKLIFAYNFGTAGMLTFNGAASFYAGALPAGAKYGRLHDGQVSGQYDRTLSGKSSPVQTQLSLAGYWQYQPNPSVLNIPAGTVVPGTTIPLPNGTQEFVGTAGSLWVTQAKITIKSAGGINIPIAVSWSNKTDLLQGSRVGAQVGISYSFSSLGSLFGISGGSQ